MGWDAWHVSRHGSALSYSTLRGDKVMLPWQIRSDLSRHPAVLAAVQETGTPLRQAMQQWHPDNTDAVSRAMSDTVTSEMFVVLGLRVSLDTFSSPDPCLESPSRES